MRVKNLQLLKEIAGKLYLMPYDLRPMTYDIRHTTYALRFYTRIFMVIHVSYIRGYHTQFKPQEYRLSKLSLSFVK